MTAATPPDLTCEICEKEPAVGVAAVPGVPYSAATGRNCLEAGAIPYWVAVANTAAVGGLDEATDWWCDMVTATLTHLGTDRAQFDADVAEAIADFDAYMQQVPPTDE